MTLLSKSKNGVKKKSISFPEKKNPGEIPVPKKRKRKARRNPPAKDVVKYFTQKPYRGEWRTTLRAMYALSRYQDILTFKYYSGKHNRKGRFYFQGIDELVRMAILPERTVKRHLAWMKSEGLIRLCKRGWPDQGASIWELPYNIDHVFAWKRRHKKSSR